MADPLLGYGTLVIIADESEFAGQTDAVGKVMHARPPWYRVQFEDGSSNSYRSDDLVILTSEQAETHRSRRRVEPVKSGIKHSGFGIPLTVKAAEDRKSKKNLINIGRNATYEKLANALQKFEFVDAAVGNKPSWAQQVIDRVNSEYFADKGIKGYVVGRTPGEDDDFFRFSCGKKENANLTHVLRKRDT